MIAPAVLFLRDVLGRRLGIPGEVKVDSAVTLVEEGAQGVTISLINLEEEAALRNLPVTLRPDGQTFRQEPPVHLNLYLLFAFEFGDYETTLIRLGQTAELFQEHRWFGPETQGAPGAVAFPAGMDRIVMDLHGMNFEALNNLWSILGGTYRPSLVYRLRLVRIQAQTRREADEVAGVRVIAARKPAALPSPLPRRRAPPA